MRRSFAVILASLAITVTVAAQTSQPAAQQVAASEDADHEALRQLRTVYEQAISNKRPADLAPLLSTDFYGVMLTGRTVRNLDELSRYWADIKALIGEGGSYRTTLNPERSVILGDIALARGTSEDVVTSGGHEFRFTTLWTAVLQKSGGQWRVRQLQGSIDPVDNAFVREFMRRALVWSVVISLGVGAISGWGVAALLGRRRARKNSRA
jgi:hypothetical protein